MKVQQTDLTSVNLIEPKVLENARGFFLELFDAHSYCDIWIPQKFAQDNLSLSRVEIHSNPVAYERSETQSDHEVVGVFVISGCNAPEVL
jgi:dTDP-4-dehydrorhamnose 3,5-epimerase-like enzyme